MTRSTFYNEPEVMLILIRKKKKKDRKKKKKWLVNSE